MGIKQKAGTLSRRNSELADSMYQLKVLNQPVGSDKPIIRFTDKLSKSGFTPVRPRKLETLQINIGKLCNQTCAHCHVDAGPDRKKENMSKETLVACLSVIRDNGIPKVDITGGAPEMNQHFRWFVKSCHSMGVHVMNRCNLTIIQAHARYADLPEFFATHRVHVISSLPYFTRSRTDGQRGDGVFEDSIQALKKLNHVGYGKKDTDLILDLVYNPSGAFLPGKQSSLENEFKRQMKRRYDIDFNQLYAITNLPISRFLEYLLQSGNYEQYMTELVEAFNPSTIDGLMCRNTISVGWDGRVYDCDFNQMLDLPVNAPIKHISEFNAELLSQREIVFDQHCFGCTAGAGSSCGGEIANRVFRR